MREIHDTETLLPLLRGMIEGALKPGDGERLVNAAIKRTLYILHWISAKRSYRLQLLGFEMEDLAYDVIADLFASEEEECCRHFRNSLLAMGSLETDDDLLSAFEAILFKNVQQQSARLFAEIDPLHQHLGRGLKAHVLRSKAIEVHVSLDGRSFHRGSIDDVLLPLPAMPLEVLRREMQYSVSEARSKVVAVLEAALDTLDAQNQYRRLVRETDILQITRDIVGLEYSGSYPRHEEMTHSHDTKVLVRILHQSLDECRPWLEHTYIRTGRLTEEELGLFNEAIRLYFLDIMTGDEKHGSYAYLRICMPGLTHTRFRQTYRRRFEYILSRVMETAREHLSREESLLR